jgi:hypothetical protein
MSPTKHRAVNHRAMRDRDEVVLHPGGPAPFSRNPVPSTISTP